MEESHHLITRREILKRGAVVGGGVLWVTPVVQTLGMGSAYAAPVSGSASPCLMPLNVTACEYTNATYYLTIETLIPSGCPCNPLPEKFALLLDSTDPSTDITTSFEMVDLNGGHWKTSLSVSVGDILRVVCRRSMGGVENVWGERLTVTNETVAGCGP